jgi:acyl-CoA reductase-like NAD-dependent aldehyde dehydrogenase
MRREILSKAADLLMERQEEIAGTVTEETGGCSAGACST